MRSKNPLWLSILLATGCMSAVCAATAGAPGNKMDVASAHVLAAAEPFETLAEDAFSAGGKQLTGKIAAADSAAKSVIPVLSPAAATELAKEVKRIHDGRAASDKARVALASIEAYRVLVSSAHPGAVPTSVNLLDYAGFRYQTDLKTNPVRWPDAIAAADYARKNWTPLATRVHDSGLKMNVENSVREMEMAAKNADAKGAKMAVKSELDLVDRLENYFNRTPAAQG